MFNTGIVVVLLMLGLVLAWALPAPPGARGIAGYVPLHTLLETIAIVIALLVFAVGWNAYTRERPVNIMLLACAFLGVGLLDFSHMLSFPGMPDFVTPSSLPKAIDFWLAARALAACALFAVVLVPWRLKASNAIRYALLAAVLAVTALAHWLFLFHPDMVPRTFVPGQGLTVLKIGAEYTIIVLNLLTAIVLLTRARGAQTFNVAALFGAVCAMAMSEFFFTLYTSATDIFNLLGHVYKIVSYLFLYRAIFVESIEAPYHRLHAALGEISLFNAELEHRVAERTMQVEEARQAAEAANRAKGTFLATVSHEIRTPMNGVLGMLELLSLTKLDGEQRTTLEVVRASGKSLLRIIDDILDFSKIEAGKLEIRPEAASIAAAIESVRNIFAGNANSKGVLLKHGTDPRISPAVLVDPLRLRQILNNFVSNAIKFTTKGSIEIKAELVECADGQDRVRFSVTDTGIGIAAATQQQLFQPFAQAEANTAHRYGGTGLGLAICRRLAEMMGGSVEMVSVLGKGTTMSLNLTLPIADPKELKKTDPETGRDLDDTTTRMRRMAPTVAQAEIEGTLVLVVDDHPTNRMVLLRQVNNLGYAAEIAENGVEALNKWKSGRFAAVISDCNMPEMDGYELARCIRGLESANGGTRTPIIACTANALGGEAEKCFAAGMDDYLVKPVELSALLRKLEHWLPIPDAAAMGVQTSGKRSAALEPGPGATDPLDRSVLAEIAGGDATAERDILMDFRRANDGDAALLKQAVDQRDMSQITRAAHRIKGASNMVGAVGLASVCERIEQAGRAHDLKAIEASMEAYYRELERLNAHLDAT